MLKLVTEFSKLERYKSTMHKLVAVLYSNNKLSERESNKTIPFTIVLKKTDGTEFNHVGAFSVHKIIKH